MAIDEEQTAPPTRRLPRVGTATVVVAALTAGAALGGCGGTTKPASEVTQPAATAAPPATAQASPVLVADGQKIFRFDTFGDEQVWTDTLRLHEVVEKNVDPTTALKVGLKVDADVLPPGIDLMTEALFDEVVNVHFKGVYFLTQRLLPLMNDGGRIVNISSGLTRISVPGSSAYAAAKGAVEVLTRYLAKELGPRRITANVVAPGPVQTDFSGAMVRDNPEINQQVSAMTALGRPGVADDIGPMIAGLLSEENRWVNAQRIEVSGGLAL
jgi:NAD(P)-dependent dehydrogenase (short-subunit alcohol dehydrogenase family)